MIAKILIIISIFLISCNENIEESPKSNISDSTILKSKLLNRTYAMDSLDTIIYSKYSILREIKDLDRLAIIEYQDSLKNDYIYMKKGDSVGLARLKPSWHFLKNDTADFFYKVLNKSEIVDEDFTITNKENYESEKLTESRKNIKSKENISDNIYNFKLLKQLENVDKVIIIEKYFKTKLDYVFIRDKERIGLVMLNPFDWYSLEEDTTDWFYHILDEGQVVIPQF